MPIFLSVGSTNKKGMCHMVEVLTFQDTDENYLCVHQLDANTTWGTTNRGATEAVNYSLEKLILMTSKSFSIGQLQVPVVVVVVEIDLQMNC